MDQANTERNEVDGQPKGLLHWKILSGSNTSKMSATKLKTIDLHKYPHQNEEVHEEPIQNGEVHELGEEAEVVPIVARPGHIRLEPLEKEHAVEQNQVPVVCFNEVDLIAYRILELSSSWTPELSPYRVGKVSWVNTESRQIMLMPVPDYPVVSKKLDEDEYVTQPDNSLYNEDGSLEIDLSSLVDFRIVKGGNTGQRNASPCDNEGPVGNDHVT